MGYLISFVDRGSLWRFGMFEDEVQVLNNLGEAWNGFLKLPVMHNDDVDEFRRLIHACQEKVMARAGARLMDGMYYYHKDLKEWGGPFRNLTQAYGHFMARHRGLVGMTRDSFIITSSIC